MVKKTRSSNTPKNKTDDNDSIELQEEQEENSMENSTDNGSLTKKLGLKMDINTVRGIFLTAKVADKISMQSVIYMSAVVDFLVEEIIFCSIDAAVKEKQTVLRPRHIAGGLMNDNSFFNWLKSRIIPVYSFSKNKMSLNEIVRNDKNFLDENHEIKKEK